MSEAVRALAVGLSGIALVIGGYAASQLLHHGAPIGLGLVGGLTLGASGTLDGLDAAMRAWPNKAAVALGLFAAGIGLLAALGGAAYTLLLIVLASA